MIPYALGPNSQTGAHQRHVDRCLGLDQSADDSYVIQAPGYDKLDVPRSVHDIPVALPHEALHDELTGTPQVLEDLQSLVDRDALPPTYTTHPVVAPAHGAAVVPLAFYCDGAPFAEKDGFLAFWIQNLISGSRTLACVLRKSSLCQCGCRGYCTLFPVLNVLRWSIGVIRSQSRRGALAAKAAVIYIKGDWMDYVTTMSFTSWTHNVHPCPMCFCSPDTMHDLKNCTLESVGWDLKTIDHYMEECERREIHVVVDGSGHVKIRNSLRITHRRERGGRARQLMVDIPEYGLRAHDRLEPTPWMSEYAMFDATARFPAPFVFRRADEQAWTQHRNPLFDRRLGGVPQRVIVGALHCLFLGVVQR